MSVGFRVFSRMRNAGTVTNLEVGRDRLLPDLLPTLLKSDVAHVQFCRSKLTKIGFDAVCLLIYKRREDIFSKSIK